MSDLTAHDSLAVQSASTTGFIDQLCDRFEAQWKANREPRIDEFLREGLQVVGAGGLRELLYELVTIDLEFRWRAAVDAAECTADSSGGQATRPPSLPRRARLADYVKRFPLMGPVDRLPAWIVAHEQRVCGGDRPQVEPSLQPPLPVERGKEEDRPDALGELGEYILLEKHGAGGMGVIYKGIQKRLRRRVAVKVLAKKEKATWSAIARFEREMAVVGQLDHPNIVSALHAGETDEVFYLVMEFVDGLDLAEIVRRCGPLPIADACELIRQAAEGLQYIHEHRLVHRDIKPSNLMLNRKGQTKILDLGLARICADLPDGDRLRLTTAGQALGTPDYMAPEQVFASHTADIRADVYSLGSTLFKLLTGRAPFAGEKYHSANGRMMARLRDPAPPIREFRDDVPPKLAATIDQMLARDPNERFAEPAEVATLLAPYSNGHDLVGLLNRAEQASASASQTKH